MADFEFNVEKELGKFGVTGLWEKRLNLISWGGNPAKYDLRAWSPDGKKMGKGLSLSKDELNNLKELLNSIDIK